MTSAPAVTMRPPEGARLHSRMPASRNTSPTMSPATSPALVIMRAFLAQLHASRLAGTEHVAVNLPLAGDALPDDDVLAPVDDRPVARAAHILADLDRGRADDLELAGQEFERMAPAARELEHRLDLGTPANRLHVRRQHLRILGVAGGDRRDVVLREQLQEAAAAAGDLGSRIGLRRHGATSSLRSAG